ncbi:MAG: LacI family transcriptional regulator [Treponema sp.]|jgi:DNA-binding LacI/PurR family transcriptional regulator|nr:LacI family transcriptional regulator [Treponema sp.]
MKTIVDVANAANVSVATVSKVFNGYQDIADETREKILHIAKDMDYFPNHFASQLVNGKEEGICVILSMFGYQVSKDEYLVGILSGIHSEAEKHGLRVIISTEKAILRDGKNYVQFCGSNKFMGFIIHGLNMSDPEIPHLVESEVPCVFIDITIEGKKKVSVTTDNEKAAAEMTGLLAGLGHRHIGFVAGSVDSWVTPERVKGYCRAMGELGLNPCIIQSDFTYPVSYDTIQEHILKHPETTALFCASDVIASAALAVCADLGYAVPKDISVAGYDDLSFTSYLRPQLSSVAQNFFGLGAAALSTLISIYQEQDPGPIHYVPYEIKMRQSVAKNTRQNQESL